MKRSKIPSRNSAIRLGAMNMKTKLYVVLVTSLAVSAPVRGQVRASAVKEATAEATKNCKPLGQIIGESMVCSKRRAIENGLAQAEALGATHIIWLPTRCVLGQGEKAPARIFDCAPAVSLDDDYEDYLVDPSFAAKTLLPRGPARIMSSSNLDVDSADLGRRGFVLIGYLGMSGGRPGLDAIRTKSEKVGSEITLLQIRGAGVDVEYQSITSYSGGGVGVSFSSGFGSAVVGGTTASGSGFRSTVTGVPGSTSTEMVPYSERRFETQVLFWRRLAPGPLGLSLELLPVELRASLGRNTGGFVVAVEDESPAFLANVLVGDVIVRLNTTMIRTPAEFVTAIGEAGDGPIVLGVIRAGKEMEIQVR